MSKTAKPKKPYGRDGDGVAMRLLKKSTAKIESLREVNAKLFLACKAKLAALKGKEYDPNAFDEAARLCEEAIAFAESKR